LHGLEGSSRKGEIIFAQRAISHLREKQNAARVLDPVDGTYSSRAGKESQSLSQGIEAWGSRASGQGGLAEIRPLRSFRPEGRVFERRDTKRKSALKGYWAPPAGLFEATARPDI